MARIPRRLFQFSLRTFLIAVTVLAIWLGVQFNRPRITAENLDQLEVIATMPVDLHEIKWSRDGSRVAFLSWEKPAEIREAKTLFHFGSLGLGKAPIHVALSPDRNVVAYCENGTTLEIQRLDTGQTKSIETGNPQPQMEFSPDGTLLATGGYGTRAAVWDVASGQLVRKFDVGPIVGGLTTVFSKDGKTLAVGHRNSQAKLFDVATGKETRVLQGQMTHGLQFDPTGKRLAVSYVNGDIVIYDAQTGALLCRAASGAEEMYKVDWSPDGRMLASAGLEGDIIIWDPANLSVLRRIAAPEWVIDVKFTPDGTRLITAGGTRTRGGKREVQVWAVPQPWTRWLRWN